MASRIVELGCPEKKVKVQHLGVNVNNLAFKPRQWKVGEPFKVLIAASIREKKGIPYAIEALGMLIKDVPVELTIIGDATRDRAHQSEKGKILSLLEQTGLKPVTRLLGYQSYSVLKEEAYKHHLFLQPSVTASSGDTEGGVPVTIIEMAATGIPIISTRHCDIPGVIIDNETGLLANERDAKGIYKHLCWFVENPHQWRPMLDKGRTHVNAEFNSQIQALRLSELYNWAVDKK